MRADRGFQWLWSQIQVYECFPNIINVFGMLSASYVVQWLTGLLCYQTRNIFRQFFPIFYAILDLYE